MFDSMNTTDSSSQMSRGWAIATYQPDLQGPQVLLPKKCWSSFPRRPHWSPSKPALERGVVEKQPPEDGPLRCLCRHCQQDKPVKWQVCPDLVRHLHKLNAHP